VGAERLPAISAVLAFDDGGGIVAFATANGRPGRLDLRNGRVHIGPDALSGIVSADGWSLFGVSADGHLIRSTPSADWKGPQVIADTLLGLLAGGVVLVSHEENSTRLIRLKPPANNTADTLHLPRVDRFVRTVNGDRLYTIAGRNITAIETRPWTVSSGPKGRRAPRAAVSTPSGDRLLILEGDGTEIRIWDRYRGEFIGQIALPSPASELRMDALGRFALAREDSTDRAFVVSLPRMRVERVVGTQWRADLPLVAPDGRVMTLRDGEVVPVNPETGVRGRRIPKGGQDLWLMVSWDGFRPRASSLDAPATFDIETPADSAAAAESLDSQLAAQAARASGGTSRDRRVGSGTRSGADTTAGAGYYLQFASLLSESGARGLVSRIRVDGRPPRVIVRSRDGVSIYYVVLGPYASHDEADAAGARSGLQFVVIAGLP